MLRPRRRDVLMRLSLTLVLLIGALSFLVLSTACGSAESEGNPFGFTIPEEIQTLEDAVAYAEQQDEIRTDEVEIAFGGGGVSDYEEVQSRDVRALVLAENGEEYLRTQERWAGYLQELFDRWDICNLSIGWGVPESFEVLGLDPDEASRTPGCN
jgi:hypothetical protein